MLLKTLLNRVHPVKGFVYKNVKLVKDELRNSGDTIPNS